MTGAAASLWPEWDRSSHFQVARARRVARNRHLGPDHGCRSGVLRQRQRGRLRPGLRWQAVRHLPVAARGCRLRRYRGAPGDGQAHYRTPWRACRSPRGTGPRCNARVRLAGLAFGRSAAGCMAGSGVGVFRHRGFVPLDACAGGLAQHGMAAADFERSLENRVGPVHIFEPVRGWRHAHQVGAEF